MLDHATDNIYFYFKEYKIHAHSWDAELQEGKLKALMAAITSKSTWVGHFENDLRKEIIEYFRCNKLDSENFTSTSSLGDYIPGDKFFNYDVFSG